MWMFRNFFLIITVLNLPVFCNAQMDDSEGRSSAGTVNIGYYEGQAVKNNFGELLTSSWKPLRSYIRTVFINYQLDGKIRDLTFETEAQFVKHRGLQDHLEINGLLAVRWRPVQQISLLSVSTGHGISYATEAARLDRESTEKPPRALHYFYAELAVDLYDIPYDPRVIFRIHHRSGVFGLYCGQNCGSNIPSVGFQFPFRY